VPVHHRVRRVERKDRVGAVGAGRTGRAFDGDPEPGRKGARDAAAKRVAAEHTRFIWRSCVLNLNRLLISRGISTACFSRLSMARGGSATRSSFYPPADNRAARPIYFPQRFCLNPLEDLPDKSAAFDTHIEKPLASR
jgi:hypothetical protein